MRKPKPQLEQGLDPRDYHVRIVVFGSRHYTNKKEFHEELLNYMEQFDGQPILFISGAAKSGADDYIIRWCRRYKYPCLQMPADWDQYGNGAGFMRNTEMAKISTHGLGFWNGISGGTKHMNNELTYYNVPYRTIIVKTDK